MSSALLSSTPPGLRASRQDALTLDLVRDEPGFHALQPFWDPLVDQMATRSPFLRWDWLSLWWEECRKGARLVIAVLRDAAGLPQAIAPLMLASESDRARSHLVTLTFLAGFGDAHGERLDLIVPAGQEHNLTPQLCRVFKLLRHECDNVRLNHLPEESPNTQHILAALTQAYTRAGILNRQTSRFITLPAAWADYEARHSSKWRNLLRRRDKAFTTHHAGIASVAGQRHSFSAAMTELRTLHASQWPAGVSSFITPASWRFHQRLAARWLPLDRALLPMLETNGKVIALLYGFIERGEFFHFQTGWLPSFAKISPGKLVLRWAIESSIQRGLRVYDMLPGDYDYKRQWCDGTRWLLDLEAFNPTSWRATIFHTLRTVRRWFSHRRNAIMTASSVEQDAHAPSPCPVA